MDFWREGVPEDWDSSGKGSAPQGAVPGPGDGGQNGGI